MATLQNIGKLKYRGKDGQWHPLPVVVQDAGGGVSTISGKGQPTESTVGRLNQLYRDESTDKLYICTGVDGGYTWAAVVPDADGSVSTISGKGAPTSATQGEVNQLYRDEDTQKLYICTEVSDGGYTWAAVSGSGGTVDVDATLTKAGQAADAKAAGDAIGKKLDAPQTAAVGEVLTVEEVDKDSKPIKWKAAKVSGTFVCTFNDGEDGWITCDKTVEEIITANNDGKDVIGHYYGEIYRLSTPFETGGGYGNPIFSNLGVGVLSIIMYDVGHFGINRIRLSDIAPEDAPDTYEVPVYVPTKDGMQWQYCRPLLATDYLMDELTDEEKALMQKNLGIDDLSLVKYTEQGLTEDQKQQARKNIGAGTSNFSGSYNDLTNTPVLDTTLEQSGKPADAKAVGDAIGSAIDAVTTILGASKVDKSQGTENAGKILGIGASGIVTPVDKPVYTLPIATPTALGGVMPVAKTTAMTQGVGVSEDGKLYTAPSGGGTDKSLGITSATVGQIAKITAVDAAGKPTGWEPVDMPSGGTYTLPIASPAVLGGVKPIAKTDAMTQGVGVDDAGALWTAALGGNDWEIIAHIDVAADVANNVTEWLYSNLPRYKYIAYKKINLKGSTETASGCSIIINGGNMQPSGLSYAKSTGAANGHGLIYVMPFGWGHVATADSNSPNNHAIGGTTVMYNTIELTDNAITSIKLIGHNTFKIKSGDIWLYGKK